MGNSGADWVTLWGSLSKREGRRDGGMREKVREGGVGGKWARKKEFLHPTESHMEERKVSTH